MLKHSTKKKRTVKKAVPKTTKAIKKSSSKSPAKKKSTVSTKRPATSPTKKRVATTVKKKTTAKSPAKKTTSTKRPVVKKSIKNTSSNKTSNTNSTKKKRTGEVYWANSRKIDKTDKKIRRQYAVVKDDGKNVKVSKVRGFNENVKNKERLMELDMNRYPLTKRSGIDKHVHTKKVTNENLRLEDKEVFDSKPSFKLSSHDTHRLIKHTTNKKRK